MYAGRVPEGLALLDEAMVGIAAGEVSPIFAGEIYCSMIEACQEVSDFGRAAEWTSALTAWVRRAAGPGAVHRPVRRAPRARSCGCTAPSPRRSRSSSARCSGTSPPGRPSRPGWRMAERGDVLRIRGDYAARRGGVRAGRRLRLRAAAGPGAAVAGAGAHRGGRRRGPAAARRAGRPGAPVPAAAGRRARCCWPSTRSTRRPRPPTSSHGIAAAFGCAAMRAMADQARREHAAGRGRPGAAVPALRRALRVWRDLEVPYEAARARVLVGRALRDLGDADTATGELAAARRTFTELGAAPAAREATALLAARRTRPASPSARSRCCGSSPRGRPTPRSPPGW